MAVAAVACHGLDDIVLICRTWTSGRYVNEVLRVAPTWT